MTASDELIERARGFYKNGQYSEALSLYLELANKGMPDFQTFVGWMYAKGEGTDKNKDAAIYWCSEAANQGDKRAEFYLAKLYINENDKKKAFEWMERAADRGYGPALFRLGDMYEAGYVVPVDMDKALTLYDLAHQKGHLFAKRRVASSLVRGCKGIKGRVKGLVWLVTVQFQAMACAVWTPDSDAIRI